MIFSVQINNQTYKIDAARPLDVSIPLNFNGAQPNVYAAERASSNPCETESLIGDTRRGGSCNFEQIKFIPHCNGTHTESVGHITRERISVHECLRDAFIFAVLVSVEPEDTDETNETYTVELNENDKLITKKTLENALLFLEKNNSQFAIRNLQSLIIRTLPNDENKLTRNYLENIPPFFSTEAMRFIREIGIKHLLVDMPSIDRIFDEGKLANHRIFWNIEQGSFETNENSFVNNTITELIYVPDKIADTIYLLNLQIPAFASDAAPSRPILFKIYE